MHDVVVVGAGQAGLSAAYHLRRAGLDPLVLDGGRGPGGAWQERWDSLTMAETHAVHDLPGVPLPAGDPAERANVAVPRYYAAYERENDLRVVRPVTVDDVAQDPEDPALLRVRASVGAGPDPRVLTVRTRTLVNATGTWTRPFWPRYPGMETFRGRQLHTRDFRAAEDFAGQHVVVVGGGASATQLLLQIAPHASGTTWVTRREPVWVEEEFSPELGRAAVARVAERTSAGLPPGSVVSVTGLPLTPRYRAGIASGVLRRRPMFERVTASGVEWAAGANDDGLLFQPADVVLWATGFRAALDHLASLGLRGPGGGIVLDGTTAARDRRVQLVGYGPSASTIGANRAGREAARGVLRALAASPDLGGAAGSRLPVAV
ncbi:FAD-dependent oxidoreductase [Cellulosimicrobium sp. NPDC057862]|uniref:FAD-dependent oxidoreductase n=1 Tax=Cellulosimicrobium sp. NPDC057862 TaxID=3346266 RepID=UPI003671430D